MNSALLSPNWYRVASLKPRLRAGVRIARHRVRGESWVVLTDPVSGRHHRFDRHAWALLAGCDGRRTLDELWTLRSEAEVAPTQEQALGIISQAFGANLLLGDVPPEARSVLRVRRRERSRQRLAALNPLAFRVPLFNPDAWLTRQHEAWAGLFNLVYGRTGALLLAALLFIAIAMLAVHGTAFGAHAAELIAGPRFWLLAWMIYPVVKALHELAHAFAVKQFGGEVTTFGITVLVLMPVPYVDASAAIAWPDKRRRAVVAAAGIASELSLAALALALWALLQPGWARDVAAAVVMAGGVSTVLVNGNPLLRFDGYHVATDLLELPNLASRSALWWRFAWRRLCGAPHAAMAHVANGERIWLIAYAPLSLLVQLALMAAAVGALAPWNGWLAVIVALLALGTMVLRPLVRAIWWVLQAAELHGTRARALGVALGVSALGAIALAAVPLPNRSYAPGLVWLPDDAFVRSSSEGFVVDYPLPDGARVDQGAVIVRLTNDSLTARADMVAAELQREQIEQARRFGIDALTSTQAADRIAKLRAEQAELARQLDALDARAPHQGRLVLDPQSARVGAFVARGQLLAHVLPESHSGVAQQHRPLVRAFVANDDITRVDIPGTVALVTLAQGGQWNASVLPARVAATRDLPSAALGEAGGGSVPLDPADGSGLKAAEPRMQIELLLPADAPAAIGSRVLVTFDHGSASALALGAGALRKLFLRQLDQ